MSPNGILGTPCAAKGTVSHRQKRFLESSIEFSEEITALLSASPLSSFVLFSPASAGSRYSTAESAALSGLTAYASGDDKYKYISVGNII